MTGTPGGPEAAREALWVALGLSDADIDTRQAARTARTAPCAHCGAKPWDPCTSLGALVPWTHPTRKATR